MSIGAKADVWSLIERRRGLAIGKQILSKKLERASRLFLLVFVCCLSSCASLVGSVTSGLADNLSSAILNSKDIETVREAIPAYLVLIDSFLIEGEANPALYLAASQLNGAFSSLVEPQRATILSEKAFGYAKRGACLSSKSLCNLETLSFSEFEARIAQVDERSLEAAYQLGVAWTGYIQTHSSDMMALGQLGRVKAILERVLVIDPAWADGAAQLYMGGLETILPASLGGRPEKGRAHFERAIDYSGGQFLMAKVIYAEQYAKLTFDQALHDRLLNEVLAADPVAPELTLINLVAQGLARELLAESNDYF